MTATTEHEAAAVALATSTQSTEALSPAAGLRKSQIRKIPLNVLFLSEANVRTNMPTEQGLDELAALILAQGLLNPLQVSAETVDDALTGRYGVEAGGRRLRALIRLAGKGLIQTDELIDCTVIAGDTATEVSLAENIGQEAMHPADEFLAFQKLVSQKQTIEAIAAKFGTTVLQVKRRLKLANVAPEFMQMYRGEEITLDVLMALASVDDHTRQLAVWNSLPTYSRSAQSIKRRLGEEEVQDNDARVKVVGLANYVAAGGEIWDDLFSESGTRYLTDPGLLDMLVGELLERKAQALRVKGWSWVEVLPAYGYEERKEFVSLPPRYFPESAEIAEQRVALENQIAELEQKIDVLEDSEEEADETGLSGMYEQVQAHERAIEALKESRLDISAVDMTQTGAVVFLSDKQVTVVSGLVRAADQKKLRANLQAHDGGSVEDGSNAKTRPAVPESLMLNLTSHRTAAIQALMLSNHKVTLAVLACRMASTVFHATEGSMVKISLTQSRYALEKNAPTYATSKAAGMVDSEREAWLKRLPEDKGQWLVWLLSQSQDVVLSLIVFATANTVDVVQSSASFNAAKDGDTAVNALGLDMADWWQPTPEAYLNLVPKAKIVDAVTEVVGSVAAESLTKMKKQAAVAHAAQLLEGKRWLPPVLRVAAAETGA